MKERRRPKMTEHVCPVPRCDEFLDEAQVVCQGHWRMLPKSSRSRIMQAKPEAKRWARRQGRSDRWRSEAVLKAPVRDAIAALASRQSVDNVQAWRIAQARRYRPDPPEPQRYGPWDI